VCYTAIIKGAAKEADMANKRIYRLHYTCVGGHTTYQDFRTLKAAKRNMTGGTWYDGGWWLVSVDVL
jgi:hypothetical protein